MDWALENEQVFNTWTISAPFGSLILFAFVEEEDIHNAWKQTKKNSQLNLPLVYLLQPLQILS